MPAAEQMANVAELFTSIDFWRLRPAPQALAEQPGTDAPRRFISAAASERRDLLVVYTPEAQTIEINAPAMPRERATWTNPRTGARTNASGVRSGLVVRFDPPGEGDWILIAGRGR
jgi:hypothetical protein